MSVPYPNYYVERSSEEYGAVGYAHEAEMGG